MINANVIADAVKAMAVGDTAVIGGYDVCRRTKRVFVIAGQDESFTGIAAAAFISAAADAAAADAAESDLITESGYAGMAADLIADYDASAAADVTPADASDLPADPAPADVPAADAGDSDPAADPDSADAYAAMQAVYSARRADLPAADVIESACLADAALRTVTPALAAALAADPALDVTGVPCFVSIGTMMRPARVIALESRPDAALSAKNGESADYAYPGLLMVRESNQADVWHKLSRRTVMIAESLACIYDANKPAKAAKAGKAAPAAADGTKAAPTASKAAAGLISLQAKAAKAAAAVIAAQKAADAIAAALADAKAAAAPAADPIPAPAPIPAAPAPALILPAHLSAPAAPASIIIARR